MEYSPNLLTPDLADVEKAVFRAMWKTARESGLSRAQIVDRMNEIAVGQGRKLSGGSAKQLSEAALEKWLNDNDAQRPSFYALGVFCKVVGSNEPINAQAAPHGYRVITDYEAKVLRLKQLEIEESRIRAEKVKLRREVGA